MTKKIDDEALKAKITKHAEKISEEDIKRIVEGKSKLFEKLGGLPDKFHRFTKQVKLLFELINDYFHGTYKQVPWYTVTMIAAATLYVLAPLDSIPDFIPFLGYLDDAVIVAFVWKGVEEDLKAYCKFKKYDEKDFFSE